MEEDRLILAAPRHGVCPVCAVEHEKEYPHNPNSLYYQMRFHQRWGRFPTWADAMAHCPTIIKEAYISELTARGIAIKEV